MISLNAVREFNQRMLAGKIKSARHVLDCIDGADKAAGFVRGTRLEKIYYRQRYGRGGQRY